MKVFSLFKKDLLILLRSRAEMAVLFLMPLAFIIPISFALGAGDGYGINRSNQMILLPVADYDGGPRAQALLGTIGESLKLEKDYGVELIQALGLSDDPTCDAAGDVIVTNPACMEKAGQKMVENSSRTAVLVIPKGFSRSVDAGEQVQVQLVYDPAGDSIRWQQVEGVVKGATIKLSLQKQVGSGLNQLNDLVALAPENVRKSVEEQAATPQPAAQQPALSLVKISPENAKLRPTPDTYQQTIPGYTVMYVFFIITTLASSIRQERLQGTFRRLLTTPASRAELLGGKLLATMFIGLVQVFLLFGVGAVAFKLDLGKEPLAFFLLTLALVAAATAIGLAASTTRLRGGAVTAPLIIAAVLGGCMFPLDLMPPFLRALSFLAPHSYALTGYQNLMVRGQGLQGVFPQILALAAFAAVFFWVALRRFDFNSSD